MPNRGSILLASAGCAGCFGIHYLRLDSTTGFAMNAISMAQSLLAARVGAADEPPDWMGGVFAASLLLAIGLTLYTWNGWPSAFIGAAALLSTGARLQASPQAMRGLLLLATLCCAGHNLLVQSVCGLVCDALTTAGFVVSIVRANASRDRSAPPADRCVPA